jgi:hypothetical protein
MSWEERWREGRTGWDAGQSPPALLKLILGGDLPAGLALVPGCGAGYDVLSLASPNRRVIGIDAAPTAGARFEALLATSGVPSEQAEIHIGDFFAFDPGERAQLWWDYTFFCALDPERRLDWAARVDALLAEDAELITLIFPTADFGPKDGPPYTIDVDLIQRTLGPGWTATLVEPVAESHPKRAGLELLARWKRV